MYFMRNFFRILFLVVLLNLSYSLKAENNSSVPNLLLPSATITLNTTSVCKGGTSPIITFTGKDGTAPYTFTYKIGTGATIDLVSTGNNATLNVPNTSAGFFVYNLVSVKDSSGGIQPLSDNVAVTVNPSPVVDFTFDNDDTCSGTTIQFTNNTTGIDNYTYLWDFGKGKTSTLQNPVHTFTELGCGTVDVPVKLTVTGGGYTVEKTKFIRVKQQPDIGFVDSNNLFEADYFTNCSNASTSNTSFEIKVGNISTTTCASSYSINWGDGTIENNITFPMSHVYTTQGVFSMIISVWGTNGCRNTKNFLVKNLLNPSGGILSPGGTTDMCLPTPLVQYTIGNWATNSPGTTYSIDYGDGSTILKLNQDDMITSPYYNSSNPIASANFPVPYSYSTTSCPKKNFTIKLTVTNACKTTEGSVDGGNAVATAKPNFTAPTTACSTDNVLFTNTSILGYSANCSTDTVFTWDFGDLASGSNNTINTGLVNITPNANHIFSAPGTYTVKLTASSGGRCISSASKTQQICIEAPPIAQFTLINTVGCAPQSINTTNTTVDSCNLTTYVWSVIHTPTFCGVNIPTIPNQTTTNASYNFTEPGTYEIKLTATNPCGSSSTSKTLTIKKPPTVTLNPIASNCQTSPSNSINPTANVTNCGTQTLSYEWSFPGGNPATSTDINPSVSYSGSGNFSYSLKVTNECGATSANGSFTIKPTPQVDDIPNQQKCNGQLSNVITFVGSQPGTIFNWKNSNTSIGLPATGSGNINPFTLTNTGTTILTATLEVTPSLNGCSGTPKTFTISVSPEPTVNNISNLKLCHNAIQNGIVFASAAAGTSFSWTNDTPSIGLAANGTGNIPNFTATNSGNSPVEAIVTVTPSNALGCNGDTKTFTITVNPTPSAIIVTNKDYCNGVVTTPIIFNNTVAGTTYTWTNSNPAIGIAANGTGNIPVFTPKNNTSAPITATISITPTANGCPGATQTFTITVNPSPAITFSIPNQTICSGETSALATLSSIAGASLNWTATQPAGLSGVITNGTDDTIPAQTLINNTNSNIVVTYKATAIVSSGATCTGTEELYTITVKPKPFIATNMTSDSCSGSLFTVTPTNGSGNLIPTGTTYSWASPVLPGGLTGGTLGTNQTTINGTLTNSTNIVQTATYTVLPSFNGCAGLPFDVVVSINPKPDVNDTTDVVLCAGETSSLINFSGNISGAKYTWSSNVTSIGIALSGSDTIPSFTAINTGVTPIIATITVTPSANSCPGLSKTFTITVNPKPIVNSITNLVKCNGNTSGIILFTGSVTGTTFDWTNDTPSIGLAATGSGNIPSFIAINTGLTPIIATITVTPKANGCLGTPTTFTLTVNPTPTVDVLSNQTVCNGQQTTAVLFTGAIPNTIYNWTNDKPSIGIGANGVGNIPEFTAINNGTTPIVANITVTPTVNGCPGTTRTFSITINPSPAVTFTPSNQTISSGSTTALVTLSSIAGTTFKWDAVQPIGITGVVTAGTSTIPVQTLTNTTNLPILVTYSATAESTSSVSCQGISYTYTITVNPVPSITTTQAQTICSNTTFSIIPLDGSGNIVPAGTTYSWGTPDISGTISGGVALSDQTSIKGTLINTTDSVQTATYTVTPKSGSCIGSPFSVEITVNPSPKVIFSGANQTLCSGSSSLLISLSSPTTGNVTFGWTATIPSGITGAVATGNGTIPTQTLVNTTTTPLTVIYTATVTFEKDGVSCSGQPFDYKITVNPAIVSSSISSLYNGFNVSTVGATDGSINVTVTGGSGVYTYLWSGPNVFSATSQDISNVPAGAYSLTINDGLCSPVVLNFTLTSPLPLIIQEDLSAHLDVKCFENSTGVIKVDITQQSVGPYDYVLTLQGGGTINTITNSVAINQIFSSLAAGIYDVKVTDANGSVKTILGIVITEPFGITASTTQTNVSCAGGATGSATVTASGGNGTLTYSWNTIPIQTSATATGLIAGTYTVTITDGNSCSIPKQVTILEPNAIVTSIASQTNVLCFGDSTGVATISVSGGTGIKTYSWDTMPVQTTATAAGLAAGSYTLTVTDANGCQKNQTVIITQPSGVLSSSISSSTNVSCFGGNDGVATATVVGGTAPYSYSWNTVPTQTLATATGLKAGNYTVLISDSNGCTTSTAITITQPVGMTASITAQTNVFCSGNSTGSATVTATDGTPPYSYSWNTLPVQTSDVAVNLPKGNYTVTITDAKGCTTTRQATITEPNGIVTAIASQTNVNCFGNNTGAVSISASGGAVTLNYSWDTSPIQTTPSLTGLIAGTYNLTVTDANNCKKVQTVTITEPNDILITTVLEKDITCFNAADGAINITISGGTLNYTFAWTKDGTAFANTEDISNLSPGIYVVSVSDAKNCGPKTATFTITEPPILAITLVSQANILCFGDATGVINVSVTGGTTAISGYQFIWTGPNGFSSSNQNLTTLFAGTYDLIVTDNSGCFKTLSVTLTQPAAISISATTTPIICYGGNDASITLNITGGITPYTIGWSNLGSGTFQDNLSSGNYLVTVTDANNCIQKLNVNIPEPPIFTVNPVVKNISCFGANNGSIALNFVGGVAPITLNWNDGAVTGTTRNNLKSGTYTVTIVDGKPCTIKRTFTILEPQLLVVAANVTHALDCDNANSGAINLLVSGGSAPFTYAWSNGAVTEDLANIPAGNYLVTVADANGCSKQAQYSINRPAAIVTNVVTKTDFDCDTKTVKQTFVADVSGGVPPYQLVWSSGTVSGANNEIMNTTQNGTVILNAIDALGCKSNTTFTVAIPKLGTSAFDISSNAYTTYGNYSINDPIQFTTTATGNYISMIWDFGDGTTSTELNPVHTFTIPKNYVVRQTVTYPFGCVNFKDIPLTIEKGYVLVMPTAFTPNSDRLNDTFRPVAKGLKKMRLDIYDSWGSIIYSETGDILIGWNGKIKNFNAENGNYYCKVSGETFYGTIVNENHPFVLIK